MSDLNILVISDTHGYTENIKGVFRQLNFRPRAVLFLGDGLHDIDTVLCGEAYSGMNCYAVAGNAWGESAGESETRMVDLGGFRILMMHGHTFNVDYGGGAAIAEAVRRNADVLLYGHTHKKCAYEILGEELGREKPLLVANPGSLSQPRDGGEPSFGILTVRNGRPLFSHGELM